jgi:hypothetical protein
MSEWLLNRFSRYIIESYEHVYVLISVPVVVTENQAPRNQKFSNGTNAQVKCAPQGDVQVSWFDRNFFYLQLCNIVIKKANLKPRNKNMEI